MTQNHYQVSISEVFFQESWSGGFRTGRPRRFGAVLGRKTTIRCLFRRCFFKNPGPAASEPVALEGLEQFYDAKPLSGVCFGGSFFSTSEVPRGRRGGAGRDATSLRGIRPHGSPPNPRHGSAGLASAWGRPGSAVESDRGSIPVATPPRDVAKPKRQ